MGETRRVILRNMVKNAKLSTDETWANEEENDKRDFTKQTFGHAVMVAFVGSSET